MEEIKSPDSIIDYTARNEGGGRYDAWNPNDNGAGISFGLIQFNQARGSLPKLLRVMHEDDPDLFERIFGNDAEWFLDELQVRSMDLNEPFVKSMFLETARYPIFRMSQRRLAKAEYFDPVAKTLAKEGYVSVKAHALGFDTAVQHGVGGFRIFLRRAQAPSASDEAGVMARFAGEVDGSDPGGRRNRILVDGRLPWTPVDIGSKEDPE